MGDRQRKLGRFPVICFEGGLLGENDGKANEVKDNHNMFEAFLSSNFASLSPIFYFCSVSRGRIWTKLGGNGSHRSPAAFLILFGRNFWGTSTKSRTIRGFCFYYFFGRRKAFKEELEDFLIV